MHDQLVGGVAGGAAGLGEVVVADLDGLVGDLRGVTRTGDGVGPAAVRVQSLGRRRAGVAVVDVLDQGQGGLTAVVGDGAGDVCRRSGMTRWRRSGCPPSQVQSLAL